MVGRTAGGVRSLERQMVNSRRMKYLRTYLRAPLRRKQLTRTFRDCPLSNSHICNQTCLDSGDSQ